MNGLLITGLLAILGTVVGSVIKSRQETKLADKDLQSKLILRALESNKTEERVGSLSFLIKTNLISDPKLKEGIRQIVSPDTDQKGEKKILPPQFMPVGSVNTVVPTDDKQTVPLALVALKVRSGDIIDAITPVFAEVAPDLQLHNRKYGLQVGGKGGGEKLLEEKEGYIITGIDVVRGEYFGRDEVVHIQVFWQKLTLQGIDPTTEIASEKLGSGQHAKSPKLSKFRVESGYYISNLTLSYSHHTSGETFIHNIVIQQNRLPAWSESSIKSEI